MELAHTPRSGSPTVGVVLAGGAGRRIGGDKASILLQGRPLVRWVTSALAEVTSEIAVVAKAETKLPELDPEIAIWLEAAEQQHPLNGIVHALDRAGGRAVLVVAVDMPLITRPVLERLLIPPRSASHGRIAAVDGRPQPLCARYEPSALPLLRDFDPDVRTTEAVLGIGVEVEDFTESLPFLNMNSPEDLLTAAAELGKSGS